MQVWVANKNTKQKLEDIPIPFSDVKNILGEIQFKDESTRSRCRGWLVLKSRKYLQADIFFPGCEFDCRLHIRGRTGKVSLRGNLSRWNCYNKYLLLLWSATEHFLNFFLGVTILPYQRETPLDDDTKHISIYSFSDLYDSYQLLIPSISEVLI